NGFNWLVLCFLSFMVANVNAESESINEVEVYIFLIGFGVGLVLGLCLCCLCICCSHCCSNMDSDERAAAAECGAAVGCCILEIIEACNDSDSD
ncbi:hypothetical protein PFISCL1PPCAC_4650, partial [Pristionchus fissidentatus]